MRINCKEASRLASQALDGRLGWWDRLRLRFHARLCSWCGGQRRDMQVLRQACKCDESEEELSPEARQRILSIIHHELDEPGR